MEHYLASDGVSILANIVYKKIKDKIKLSINVYDFNKSLHPEIKKIEQFRVKFESKTNLGNISSKGKALKKSDDTEKFDTHWEYGTEDFDLSILKKLSKKWSLSIKW